MKLEDQVCSLELAKRLKELGVEQENLFYYSFNRLCSTGKNTLIGGNDLSGYQIRTDLFENECSAFTSDELFKLLPNRINTFKNEPFNHFRFRLERAYICKNNTLESLSLNFICNYYCDSTECSGEDAWLTRKLLPNNFHDENLSNCLAKVLIYLIENQIITEGVFVDDIQKDDELPSDFIQSY